MIRLLSLTVLFLLVSVPVPAATGEKRLGFDREILVDGRSLELAAETIKEATFLEIDVYALGLYLERRVKTLSELFSQDLGTAMELRFLVDVKQKKLTSSWIRDLRVNCETDCDSLTVQAETLARKFGDIRKGQTVAYIAFPGRVVILVDGSPVGVLQGENARRAVISAFLGKRAPKALRESLWRQIQAIPN